MPARPQPGRSSSLTAPRGIKVYNAFDAGGCAHRESQLRRAGSHGSLGSRSLGSKGSFGGPRSASTLAVLAAVPGAGCGAGSSERGPGRPARKGSAGTRRSWEEERSTWVRPACATLWSPCQSVASDHNTIEGGKPPHWSAVSRFCTTQAMLPSPLPLMGRDAWLGTTATAWEATPKDGARPPAKLRAGVAPRGRVVAVAARQQDAEQQAQQRHPLERVSPLRATAPREAEGPSSTPQGTEGGGSEQHKDEAPLQAVARLRMELRGCSVGGSGQRPVVVRILGHTDLESDDSKELVKAVARGLANSMPACAAFLGGGLPGLDQIFASHCGDGSRLWNLMPVSTRSSFGVGRDLHAGSDAEQLKEVLALLGDIYVLLGLGPASVAEARAAHDRGALIVPVLRAGAAVVGTLHLPAAALCKPRRVDQEQWELLGNQDAPVKHTAAAVVSIVASLVAELAECPDHDAFILSGCGLPELDGMYIRFGLEDGKYIYGHALHSASTCSFSQGSWHLWSGLSECYMNPAKTMVPPAEGWEPCGKGRAPLPYLTAVAATTPLLAASPEGPAPAPARPAERREEASAAGHDVAPEAGARGGGSRPSSEGGAAPPPSALRRLHLGQRAGSNSSPAVTVVPTRTPRKPPPSSLVLTTGSQLAQLVDQGCIGLVKSAYFDDCLFMHRPIAMRQSVPSWQMWKGAEALNLWRKHGKCFFCVVSYSWLSRKHPDPNGFHLVRLQRVLTEYKRLWGMPEVAVLIDYCSLWQRGPGEKDARSEEQREQFTRALREIGVPFAHKAVTSITLQDVPESEPRQHDNRGWTLLESLAADSKAGDWNRWVFSSFDPTATYEDAYAFFATARPRNLWPPLTISRFVEELERRKSIAEGRGVPLFTAEEDKTEVPERYREVLRHICKTTKLAYNEAGWGDREVELLGEVLPDCQALETLELAGNSIRAGGAAVLAKVIPKLPNLRQLVAKDNPLCNDGASKDMLQSIWRFQSKPTSGLVL